MKVSDLIAGANPIKRRQHRPAMTFWKRSEKKH